MIGELNDISLKFSGEVEMSDFLIGIGISIPVKVREWNATREGEDVLFAEESVVSLKGKQNSVGA